MGRACITPSLSSSECVATPLSSQIILCLMSKKRVYISLNVQEKFESLILSIHHSGTKRINFHMDLIISCPREIFLNNRAIELILLAFLVYDRYLFNYSNI